MRVERLTITFDDYDNMDDIAKLIDWARANNKLNEVGGTSQETTHKNVKNKAESVEAEKPEDLFQLTVNELREYADDLDIDLPNNAKKSDIVNVIENAHQEVPVETEEETPEAEEVPEAKQASLTIEDVREVFVEKNNIRGNTSKLKNILTEFGVKKVTDLEEKDFDAVLSKLKEL